MKRAATITPILFGLFIVLSLTTPSWRYGTFTWWPIWSFDHLAGGPVQIGILNTVPLLLLISWIIVQKRHGTWSWGHPAITLPLLFFSLWALVRLVGAPFRLWFIYGGDFVLVWLTYLYYANHRPPLRPILATVILMQGIIGCLQFLLQGDLGLTALGELPLNPAFAGVTVLRARGEPWLRAYGLTAHPNLYGALLGMCLLLLIVYRPGTLRQKLPYLLPVLALGLAGLFFSFSRTAWLGAGLGLAVWFIVARRGGSGGRPKSYLWLLFPAILLTLALVTYGDLVTSRFANLDEPLEARSISQRLYDADLALQLARSSPWLGVGLGRNVDAALLLGEDAQRVHNVLLLAAAELGVPGLLLVLCLLLAPVWAYWRLYRRACYARAAAGLAPWLMLLVVNQLDTTLWLTGNWQTAILFGLAAGNAAYQLQTAINERPQLPEAAAAVHNA